MTAPGMSELKPAQTDTNERIFGARYLTIQQNPDILSRRDRRKLGHRTRFFGGGTMRIPR